MNLTSINTLLRRIGFSVGLATVIIILCYLFGGPDFLQISWIPLIIVSCYIIVTLFYAVISTFFEEKEVTQDNDEILDQD